MFQCNFHHENNLPALIGGQTKYGWDNHYMQVATRIDIRRLAADSIKSYYLCSYKSCNTFSCLTLEVHQQSESHPVYNVPDNFVTNKKMLKPDKSSMPIVMRSTKVPCENWISNQAHKPENFKTEKVWKNKPKYASRVVNGYMIRTLEETWLTLPKERSNIST